MRNNLIKIAIGVIIGLAAGYYLFQPPPSEAKQTEIEQKESEKKETVIVSEKKPDGTEKTTTTITETKDKTVEETRAETIAAKPRTTVNLLIGQTFDDKSKVIYGAEVSRQFVGPFRLGVFGLTSGVYGATVGIDF